MIQKGITLRGLEVFDAVARTGSVARASDLTGLSHAAVSQHVKQLEQALGQPLIDHSRRPMQPTAAGRQFLGRSQEALRQIRQGQAEAAAPKLGHLTDLRLGVIDDFENDVTPELAIALAGAMAECRFRLLTRPSHALIEGLQAGETDLAVAAMPEHSVPELSERPLLRDPFLLALPRGHAPPAGADLSCLADLPFLRFTSDQMIGQRIEQELSRQGLNLPRRFELDSVGSLHALVAAGAGWAITTPLSYLRGQRFREAVTLAPLPFGDQPARRISLFARPWIDDVADDLARTLRGMVEARVTGPLSDRMPWLQGQFCTLT